MLSAPHETTHGSPCSCSDLHDGDRNEDEGGKDCGFDGHDRKCRSGRVHSNQATLASAVRPAI